MLQKNHIHGIYMVLQGALNTTVPFLDGHLKKKQNKKPKTKLIDSVFTGQRAPEMST